MNRSSVRQAAAHLAACDSDWGVLIDLVGPCTLRAEPGREPWAALVRAVTFQQLHGRAAQAIFNRFLALYPGRDFPTPAEVLATDESTLRGCGFSMNKLATIRGIAEQTLRGQVPDRRAAENMSDEALIDCLVRLRGIGRWTVEMLLMHTLGRPDILPVDDFGVREGWRLVKGWDRQPTPRQLGEIGRAWAPHRSTAAWYLWRAVDCYKASLPRPGKSG